MASFESIFPTFLQKCAELHELLRIVAFMLFIVGTILFVQHGFSGKTLILHMVRLFVLTALLVMLPRWGNQVQQVSAANRAERWNGHETNEKRRQRVTGKQNEFLDDVCPKQEQRRELADQPQDTGDQGFNGEAGDVSENIPTGPVAAGVAFDRKELIVLVMNV